MLSACEDVERAVELPAQFVAVQEVQQVRRALPKLDDVGLAERVGDLLDKQVLAQVAGARSGRTRRLGAA